MTEPTRFSTQLIVSERGHVRAPLPFDPRVTWGRKPRHYVEGSVAGTPFAGSVGFSSDGAFLVLSKAFRDAAGVQAGETVDVEIGPVDRSVLPE
jgi:hypothetical protein